MTTGWAQIPERVGALDAAGGRTEQGFTDALCGPDGTGDPAVLMPVLQVYPDALSAPMPDAMVALPQLDPSAALAAARASMTGPPTPTPAQARVAAQRAADRVVQPGRYGRTPAGNQGRTQAGSQTRPPARNQAAQAPPPRAGQPPPRAGQPSAWGGLEPRSAVAPHLQAPRQPGANQLPTPPASSAWTGRTMSPAEVAGFLRTTFTGLAQGGNPAAPRFQPAQHAPTPPLPRNPPRRRNKGSSVWAVLVFLIIIAFASGIAQQLIAAVSELFNR